MDVSLISHLFTRIWNHSLQVVICLTIDVEEDSVSQFRGFYWSLVLSYKFSEHLAEQDFLDLILLHEKVRKSTLKECLQNDSPPPPVLLQQILFFLHTFFVFKVISTPKVRLELTTLKSHTPMTEPARRPRSFSF